MYKPSKSDQMKQQRVATHEAFIEAIEADYWYSPGKMIIKYYSAYRVPVGLE